MDWLERLRGEGQLDSSGHFSLDFERAKKMLAGFTLKFPRQYLQFLVTAAVLNRANYWRLHTTRKGLRVEFDGSSATPEELGSLLDGLLLDHFAPERRWLRWLALGALGASREASDVWVETSQGARLWLGPTLVTVTTALCSQPTRVDIHDRKSLWSFLRLGSRDLERTAMEPCLHAPLSLEVDGKSYLKKFDLMGLLPTLVQGKASLPSVALGPRRVTRRFTEAPYSVAVSFAAPRARHEDFGSWLVVGGIRSELSRSPYRSRALIAFDELPTDLSGVEVRYAERQKAADLLLLELEHCLADAALRGDPEVWPIIQSNWGYFPDEGPLMQRPLIPCSTGKLYPLAWLRKRNKAFTAEGFMEAEFQSHPVFHPDVLHPLGRRVTPVPLCRLPGYGWVQAGFRAGAVKLPVLKYLRASSFDYLRVSGRCGLTRKPCPPMPVLCYFDESEQPIEIEPAIALPGGLHVVVDNAIRPDWELAPALVPLYQALLTSRATHEQKLYHFIEFLGYIGRRFRAHDPFGSKVSPYEASLREDQQHWTTRFDLQFAVKEFASATVLPGGVSPAQARSCWSELSRKLTLDQQSKLATFLGESHH